MPTRRNFLKLGAIAGAALLIPLERTARTALQQANRLDPALLPGVGQLPFRVPPSATPIRTTLTVPGTWIDPAHPAGTDRVATEVDYYASHMRQVRVPILPGQPPTWIWAYQGVTPGPTIHAERGRPVLVRHFNDMPDQHPVLLYGPPETSVHLHGNASLPQHDGYASDTTPPGSWKDYWYPTIQDARTLWYHDHGVHHTSSNVYMGLAGQYHLHDDAERASGLPLSGSTDRYGNPYDVPLIIRDAMFDSDAQLVFNDNDESGAFGDVILVNGVPWPNMKVEPRQYRFRMLDAAVSRSLELALSVKGSSTKLPMTVVATDGGIVEVAQAVTSLRIGMAERYEVVIDFAALSGRTLLLRNLRPANNIEYPTTGTVMQFQVGRTVTDRSNNATSPGKTLRSRPDCMGLVPTGSTPSRTLNFVRANGHWTINGKTWADVISSGFEATLGTPNLGDVEMWKITNLAGGWFHPVHIHLIDFKILSRTGGKRGGVQPFECGPKDVVYVGENETVTVIARFGPQAGRYMMHCHNLVHEDHDMMHQFRVRRPPDSPVEDMDPMSARAEDHASDGALFLPEPPGADAQYPPTGGES
jgi:FtsP/CotA-like multicopper oxidase with cupredoxin domain